MPKPHHATSVPITLRIGRVAHALAADAAEIDGRSLNNELLHLIELGLGVRAKQEIVRKEMTRDPKPPPIRMRVNPHDPYSPIARLPGQNYPGDPLVKRPKRPTPGAGGSGRGAFDVKGGAFDLNSKTGINPGINPKTGIPRGQGAQAFYESIEPPTDEELASLGDEVDTPWDEDDDPDDDGPRLVPLPKPKRDPAPGEPEPSLVPAGKSRTHAHARTRGDHPGSRRPRC